jgi:hypothetical protein
MLLMDRKQGHALIHPKGNKASNTDNFKIYSLSAISLLLK